MDNDLYSIAVVTIVLLTEDMNKDDFSDATHNYFSVIKSGM